MTIFGPDVSSYQHGLNLAALNEGAFVIAKTTEGTYYTDADYEGWRLQAASLHKPFAWYHFLSGEAATAQAAHTAANVGDRSLPGMLDFEPAGSFHPTLEQAVAYADAAKAAGLNPRLVYLPRWYWEQLGSPDLAAFRDRNLLLVSSAYPGGTGSPSAIYPGDGAAGWQPYGGMKPVLYQFTNQASDGGQPLDYNAFRGTSADLAEALNLTAPVPTPTPTPPFADLEDNVPAFATGEIKPGALAATVVLPPPANTGSAGWGNVWFSLGCDFGDATVRVAAYVHGSGWDVKDGVHVPSGADRVNPWGGPLPTGVQKISVERGSGADCTVPLSYLIEAAHR